MFRWRHRHIITIMVLDLKVPHGTGPAQLLALWPTFASYVVSFVVVAIYWVNHHRVFHFMKRVDNAVLWTNIIWLFTLSLVPFFTAYMGENRVDAFSTAMYGASLLACALTFVLMSKTISIQLREDAKYQVAYRAAVRKNYFALSLYAISIPLAYVHPAITLACAFVVAAIYFIPTAWLGEASKLVP
jgi:uncharacterized membrane protein